MTTELERLYREMRRIRTFEQHVARLYASGEIPGFCHVSIGQESVAAGVMATLRDGDLITSTHRGHGHVLARGADPARMFAELFGRPSGVCGGLGGSMHIADLSRGVLGANGIVGAGVPIATGAAWGLAVRGTGDIAVCFFGDGAIATGAFHEGVNLAAVWRLPVLFVCENNGYAEFSPATDQHPVPPTQRAMAYGIPSRVVDGRDVADVAACARDLVVSMRSGSGPALLEIDVHRWHGHYEGDPAEYRSDDDRRRMIEEDPLEIARSRLAPEVTAAIDRDVEAEMAGAIADASLSPRADPGTDLTAAARLAPASNERTDIDRDRDVRYMDAIGCALADALETHEDAFIAGIDVGKAGGIFRATRGLFGRFGPERVLDTPISESAIAGLAVGAALAGFRPVVEIMFMDFLAVCLDQLMNQAAKFRFMTGGIAELPIVVRTQYGAGRSSGAQHSQSLEAMIGAIPGLAVVIPSNPADAYGLLRSAIEDPGPVVFVEHRHLYGLHGPAPGRDHRVPLGKAAIARVGTDITLVAWGRMVHEGLKAADRLVSEGISVEVVDLRTIAPMDVDTLASSLSHTTRLAVVHEAHGPFGPGAEVIRAVSDTQAFWRLDAPPIVIAPPAVPAPYAPELERVWLPDANRIVADLRDLMAR